MQAMFTNGWCELALAKEPAGSGLERLTAREREVVERALRGSHNKAIAYDLGIAHSTLRVLMSRAASKLGFRTRRELVANLKAGAPPATREAGS